MHTENNKRIRLPISDTEGKAGSGAPGEREIRRREYTERVYENAEE